MIEGETAGWHHRLRGQCVGATFQLCEGTSHRGASPEAESGLRVQGLQWLRLPGSILDSVAAAHWLS